MDKNQAQEKAIEIACRYICHNCEESSSCDDNSPYTCPIIQSMEKEMKDSISLKQTNYQVFEVNDCFEEYGISYNLIGAINENDLLEYLYEHGKEFNLTKKQVKNIVKEKDWRIKKIEHLFTYTPYTVLDSVGYIE